MQKLNTPASLMCFLAVFLINYACAEICLMWSGLICNTCPLLPALTLTCESTHSTAGKSKPLAAIASCTGTSSFLSLLEKTIKSTCSVAFLQFRKGFYFSKSVE